MSLKNGLSMLALALAAMLSIVSCGKNTSATTATVGPKGPTDPGGYFFNLTISPSVVQESGTVFLTVHVWDSNGNNVSGYGVGFSGSTTDGGVVETASDGWAAAILTVNAAAGESGSITATVDNMSLTAPYTVVP